MLDALLEKGIRYAFLSNSDNLGATCDPDVAAWMVEHGLPYVAEVCKRTKNDRKGGHLAVRKCDGRIVLRDTAMVAEGEERYFRDIKRHNTFNANNVWVDLEVLRERMAEPSRASSACRSSSTARTSTPPTRSSPEVIQMESAMGTAIEVFEGSEAILVPRTRFRPVKTTNDLLVIRSDFFSLDEGYHVVADRRRARALRRPRLGLPLRAAASSSASPGRAVDARTARACASGRPRLRRNVVCVGDVLIDGYRRVLDDAVLGELPTTAPASVATSGECAPSTSTARRSCSTLEPSPDRVDAAHRRRSASSSRATSRGQGRPAGLRQLGDGRVRRPRPSRSPVPTRAPRCGCASSGEIAAGRQPDLLGGAG